MHVFLQTISMKQLSLTDKNKAQKNPHIMSRGQYISKFTLTST